ncbi:MAG: WD40 repeat domain-containing protein [Gemmataceae bacterium]|nr:WD40 repeat domain-containing protein [Gemmataceae bacterium]
MDNRIRTQRWLTSSLVALALAATANFHAAPAAPLDGAGDPLPPRALQRFGTARWRHGSGIQCMAFAPVGQVIAAGGGHDPIRLWDRVTGREIRQCNEPWVRALAFSTRGSVMFSAGALKVIRMWGVADGKEFAQLTGHKAAITALAVSADGSMLASGDEDGTVILWEIIHRKIMSQFKGHTDAVTSLAFSPDRDSVYVASGSHDRTVRVWHVDQQKMVHQLDAGAAVAAVAFVDDTTLASAGDDHHVRLWNAVEGKPLHVFKGHTGAVVGLQATRDGKKLISSGADATVRIWDVAARKELRTIPRHAGDGEALAVSKDGQTLACGGANNTVRVFDVTTGTERLAAPGMQAGLAQLALAPDGKSVASVTAGGTITIWDRQTSKPLSTWESKHEGEVVLAFTADGLLVSGSRNDPLRVWHPATGKEAFQFPGKPGNAVLSLAAAPRGSLIAAGYRSGDVDVWDCQQKKVVKQPRLATPGGAHALAFSTDGAILAIGGFGKVALWDIAAGKEIRLFDSKVFETKEQANPAALPAVASLAFAPDRKTLAVGCYDGAVRLFDHVKGTELRALEGHASVPFALAFSGDGGILASGSFDKTVRLWETFSGLTIASLTGHQGSVHGVALTRDGRTAFSASSDTSVLSWDVTGLAQDGGPPEKLGDLGAAWLNLASEDTKVGHRALWNLAAHGDVSVPYLGKQLYLIDPKRIDQYFKDLGDGSFVVRKNATQELERYGRWMEGRFRQALVKPPDLEVQRRIEQMLAKLTGGLSLEQERIRVRRVMLILEQVNSPPARKVLQSLVNGAPEVDLQAEARIALERLSKRP